MQDALCGLKRQPLSDKVAGRPSSYFSQSTPLLQLIVDDCIRREDFKKAGQITGIRCLDELCDLGWKSRTARVTGQATPPERAHAV